MATILSASAPAFHPGSPNSQARTKAAPAPTVSSGAPGGAPGGGSPGAGAPRAKSSHGGNGGKQKRGRGHKHGSGRRGGNAAGGGSTGRRGSDGGRRGRNNGGETRHTAAPATAARHRPPVPPATTAGFLSRAKEPAPAVPPRQRDTEAPPRSDAASGDRRHDARSTPTAAEPIRASHTAHNAGRGGGASGRGDGGGRQQRGKQHPGQRRAQAQSKGRARGPGTRGGKGRNTESFKPCFDAPDLRLVVGYASDRVYPRPYSVHDVLLVPDLFCRRDDATVYDSLLAELRAAGTDSLFTLWHGDSHLIADDKRMRGQWKAASPSFQRVVARMEEYFGMHIEATRFNHYRDLKDWKPYHHDAAAVKPRFAKIQNITVAASFGAEREVGFLHVGTGAVVAAPQPNGSCYAFGRDVNMEWKHGVLPVRAAHQRVGNKAGASAPGGDDVTTADDTSSGAVQGRVSIIAWGWVDQTVAESRIRTTV